MNLDEVRQAIDRIDAEILNLIAERMELARKAGEVKKNLGKDIFDSKREEEVIESRVKTAENLNLNSRFTAQLFNFIIKYSREVQGEKS
ncbi:MAG: Chorismate mutase [candidate division CPR2 bacterium GW2011_GWC1_41_48]|uniref:Chorismate mutase n=1 Tax=candidate division CPR2 bacterium GW2011_GWC1_41_48 TaxID=1618344 RepID=A0A0G0Z8V9_UNCC2|nr:MAG: Chorismate mutase [candidate division CPR2 bacterium GW2011_GWC2_39_35]KKR27939.1 MAG: Chorismate mutase [candidate division CPR2 bacterium GW2011_GWD1_39_7]KKR29017.1 MAG: Chorismate mutase [candidate division CPR2 bacterium GW2011_GWD2_39_7]KKS09513.1 MAG: Chorismate mutase [candidate division CPR2 bacterium GW2011_GWC1_41_48]OGB60145.1 MAG: chorismate mutase [candidate division CPR2 bacterium GWD1_39_7]OGB70415.1 MAG: chorismate mutase [candidate division CPR2 bacterium GWD2_39_7]